MNRNVWIKPEWPRGDIGLSVVTTTRGQFDPGVYGGFNLAAHVGDQLHRVIANRRQLAASLGTDRIQWLDQVHDVRVARVVVPRREPIPRTDAAWTTQSDLALSVLTADCLPVVICDTPASVFAVAHAGWRGLVEGVLANTVAALPVRASDCVAWIGPGIGPGAYQVGEEVIAAVRALGNVSEGSFTESEDSGKYQLDLFRLAEQQLTTLGIRHVYCERICTFENETLYSYRRDGTTGRMATLAWIPPDEGS